MDKFFEDRIPRHDAVLRDAAAGKGKIVQVLNLTAKCHLNQITKAEKRAATPQELELCYDFSLVPPAAGGAQ